MDSVNAPIARFLHRSTLEGERTVAYVRLGLCLFVLLERVILLDSLTLLRHGDPGEAVAVGGLVVGVLFALWVLSRVDEAAPDRLPALSALVDVVLVSLVILPQVLWPPDGWNGLLAVPAWSFWILAVVGAGFRLSRLAVVCAAVASAVALLGFVSLDQALHGAVGDPRLESLVLAGIVLSGAALLSWGGVRRTRILVEQGAAEALKAERARQRLGVYLSPAVADEALEQERLAPGGARRDVAVLFTDLRGFTSRGETLPPEQLLEELNRYLSDMVAVIHQHGGVVDKFVGDSIMVVFGIPRSAPDDALRAVRCAAALQDALEHHNAARLRRGLRGLQHGIGLHFGTVVAGNVGSMDRLQPTVVGDIVNTASRLEGLTKTVEHSVLISAETVEATGCTPEALGIRFAGTLPITGRDGGIGVFALVDDPTAPHPSS